MNNRSWMLKELAIESIQKTNDAIDEQRNVLGQQVQQELAAEKKQLIEHFEANCRHRQPLRVGGRR